MYSGPNLGIPSREDRSSLRYVSSEAEALQHLFSVSPNSVHVGEVVNSKKKPQIESNAT
jgi:hypothetical protein